MFNFLKLHGPAATAALAALILAGTGPSSLTAQQPGIPVAQPAPEKAGISPILMHEPSEIAIPLPEDRGQAAVEQSLRRLGTTASVMMIVAHPDDEDGALLTYLSRGLGVRATLFTLTRGEGGQNAMSAESYDALGLIRTNELLRATEFYGAKLLWGTQADFGFSKTQEESFAQWGHDRVLFDAVLAVRRERPQVIVSTFVGGITDGHGQHQVSGEIAQEVFKAAGDATVFPEQLKDGLQPWQPLAVYSMAPFAPVKDGKMFDYATGKWAPAKFHNYVTGEWLTDVPSTDVTLPVGNWDSVLGRSYMQIAREGWGQQKSQNGGANPTLSGPATASYHLWAVAEAAKGAQPGDAGKAGSDLFHNRRVQVDTGIAGLARITGDSPPEWLIDGLRKVDAGLKKLEPERQGRTGASVAHQLAPIYEQFYSLRLQAGASSLDPQAKASLLLELDTKIEQCQAALKELLGLDLMAFRTNSTGTQGGGPFRGGSADETPRSVSPGEKFLVRVHVAQATSETRLTRVWLESATGANWKSDLATSSIDPAASSVDPVFHVQVADNAQPTEPFFTRPSTEQPFYDVARLEWRERSFAPYPLAAWAEFSFGGAPSILVGQVVQTMERVPGPGGIYQPLVVTPAIGVRLEPEARILPLDGKALPVKVTVHAQAESEGSVELKLPSGWHSEPAEATFHLTSAGDTEPIQFLVTPIDARTGAFTLKAVARSGGHIYETGWQSVGYAGLRPYNQYKTAGLKTRKVDVKLAKGLRIGYVMGTGDLVPEGIEGLGVAPHILTTTELLSGDLSAWNVIVIGIRAYSARPELTKAQPRLNEFVRSGGTLVVQYQSASFPAPLPLTLGHSERVVEEAAPVKFVQPDDPLLTWPNSLSAADFDGWVEERGHSFIESWDAGYTALTETADQGQDPQRGGLLVAHPGKGAYIYVAYALHRQLPELVPGAYRLLANLLSAGRGGK